MQSVWAVSNGACRVLWKGSAVRRFILDRVGSTAVEFALIAPVLIAFSLGIIEFGRVMLVYNAMGGGVLDGVRYAMVRGASVEVPATAADVAGHVRTRLTGFDDSKLAIDVSWAPDNRPGDLVTVTIDYDFEMVGLALAPLPLSRSATMMVTY